MWRLKCCKGCYGLLEMSAFRRVATVLNTFAYSSFPVYKLRMTLFTLASEAKRSVASNMFASTSDVNRTSPHTPSMA